MKSIEAGYLGGHPSAKKEIEYGWLDLDDQGNVLYSSFKMVNMIERKVPAFTIPATDIVGGALAVGTKLKRGGGVREYALGGAAGVALQHRRVGRKNTPLDLTVKIKGAERVVHFAVESGQGAQWLGEAQVLSGGRWGLAAQNSDRDVASPASASVADELLKLANLRDAGILTDDEFAEQKARLLVEGKGS